MNTNEEFENKSKKKGKKWIILSVVLIAILLVTLGYYSYFCLIRNTKTYLDNISKDITTTIEKNFKNVHNLKKDLEVDDKDFGSNGNLGFDYNGKNYNIKFDLKTDYKNMSLNAGVDQNSANLVNGTFYLQDKNLYLQSEKIYDRLIKTDYTSSIDLGDMETFAPVEDKTKLSTIFTNPEDLEYFITKIIEYHIEALKEGNLSTKLNGFNEKQYIINVSTTDKIKLNDKLEDLINNDEKLANIIKKYEITDYNYLTTGELIIKVNTYNNEFISFNLKTNEETINCEYDGERYILTNENKDVIYLWLNENKFAMEMYENEKLTGSLSIVNSSEELSLNFTGDNDGINIGIKKINDKKSDISLTIHEDESKMDIILNLIAESENDYKTNVNGDGSIKIDGKDNKFTFNISMLYEKDLYKEIDTTAAVEIDKLPEAEQEKIAYNMYNILAAFGLMDQYPNIEGQ